MNQTCRTLLEKQGWGHKWCTPMDSHIWPSKSRTTSSKHTYSSSVRIRDVVLKTCQRRWTMGRSGGRGSWISLLVARYDDDDMYQGESEVLQYFSNMLRNSATLDGFAEVIKVTNCIGLCDTELAWYSLKVTL